MRIDHRAALVVTLGLSGAAWGCGARVEVEAHDPMSRSIVGGTTESGYPEVGALLIDQGGGYFALCTGTVIAEGWVLTAAHCVFDVDPSDVAFFVGDDIEDPGGAFYTVSSITVHPGYEGDGDLDDLALLSVLSLELGAYPTLNRSNASSLVGSAVTWIGFGVNSVSTGGDGIKRRGTGTISNVGVNTLEYDVAGVSPCFSDSGGPAFAVVQSSTRLVGVIAHGDCTTFHIDLRVDYYASWIDNTLAGGSPTDSGPLADGAFNDDGGAGDSGAGGDGMAGSDPAGSDPAGSDPAGSDPAGADPMTGADSGTTRPPIPWTPNESAETGCSCRGSADVAWMGAAAVLVLAAARRRRGPRSR